MMMPVFTFLGYNKDNFMQNHSEHEEKGGEHVLKMDQALSDLNDLAYVSMGCNPRTVEKAVKIMQLRQKAIEAGFPVIKLDVLDARIEEARGYLVPEEKRALHRIIKAEEEYKEPTEDRELLVLGYSSI